MKMTGAEIVVACLREQGVDTVFGYPGGASMSMTLYINTQMRSDTSFRPMSRARPTWPTVTPGRPAK